MTTGLQENGGAAVLLPIFINRRKFEVDEVEATAREILAIAGLGEGYDLLLLQGEGDPTGGRCILADETVELRSGLHFNAIPGNCTFGGGAEAPPLLVEHARELADALGREVTVHQEGSQVFIIVRSAPLPNEICSRDSSDVLLLADVQYPASAMDMFWTESDVTLADGAIPSDISSVESYLGRQWRRWSWHRNGTWTPGVDDLLSHWAFVEARWTQEVA